MAEALPAGWAKPRQMFVEPRHDKGERSSADREFDEPSPQGGPGGAIDAAPLQRDSGVPEDWDASSDGDDVPDAWDDEDEEEESGGGTDVDAGAEPAAPGRQLSAGLEGTVALS